ncbi:hypothetical protein BH09BAC4_BH09BAC4_24140 [soil metagenome]
MQLNSILPAGRKVGFLLATLTALTLSFSSCKKEDNPPTVAPTITETINQGSQFTLLKLALVKAGLDATLGAAGSYTLFAPTDDAFKLFGYGDAAAINAAPAVLLKTVLQYHVLGTKLTSATIPAAINTPQLTQASGASVYISKVTSTSSTTAISVNGAHVIQAGGAGGQTEFQASNGTVFAIDRILLPPVLGDIVATIQGIPTLLPNPLFSFKLLNQAVTKAGIGGALTAAGPLTVFAPTDNAFKASGFDSTAIAKATVAQLTSVLSYHVLNNSRTYTPLITSGSSLTTLQGGTITTAVSTSAVAVTGRGNGTLPSIIIGPDVSASNGVIQVIDRLLLP